MWPDLVSWVNRWPLKNEFLEIEDAELLFLAKNSLEAFTIIDKAYQSYMEGDKEFCLNYKKYKI